MKKTVTVHKIDARLWAIFVGMCHANRITVRQALKEMIKEWIVRKEGGR